MRAPILVWMTLVLCLLCTAANAFFYLADPNYSSLPGGSPWPPVLATAIGYVLFGLLAWSQRCDAVGASVVLAASLLAAACLLYGRGMDWYGSVTMPNYYNQILRLGSIVGGLGQAACLLFAGAGVLFIRVGRRFGPDRRAVA